MFLKFLIYGLFAFTLTGCADMFKNYYEEFSYKPIFVEQNNMHMIIEIRENWDNKLHNFSIVISPLNSFSKHDCKISFENIYLIDSDNNKINMPNKTLEYNEKASLFAYTNRNMAIKFTNYKLFFTQKTPDGCGTINDVVDYKFDLETNYSKKYYSFWDIIISAT